MEVLNNLKKYRTERRMSQQKLADTALCDRSYISEVENGKQIAKDRENDGTHCAGNAWLTFSEFRLLTFSVEMLSNIADHLLSLCRLWFLVQYLSSLMIY